MLIAFSRANDPSGQSPLWRCSTSMIASPPNTTATNDADLFREEAERARRFAAAMSDKAAISRLNQIAELYDALAAAQDPGPTDRD